MAETPAQKDSVESLIAAFEDAAQETEDSTQFWLARDLSELLGYEIRQFLTRYRESEGCVRQRGSRR